MVTRPRSNVTPSALVGPPKRGEERDHILSTCESWTLAFFALLDALSLSTSLSVFELQ